MTSPTSFARAPARPAAGSVRDGAVSIAAAIAALGGALLFADLTLQLFRGIGRAYFVTASLMALCFPALPIAYLLRGAVAPGWRGVLGGSGLMLVGAGASAWLAAFVLLFSHPEMAFTQHLTPAGSLIMAIGMVLFGASVILSRRLLGIGAISPVVVGAYFPIQLVVQLVFFLHGNDGAPGPNGAVLGFWGLLWIWAAWSAVRLRSPVS